MNFNHLLIFQKVAEKRHFTRAAEALFISQPAVSKQVQELEKTLGLALFEQVGRQIHLTEAGQILYDYACRIFALSNEAEAALQELNGLERGRLAVGASTTIGTYLLPNYLGQFKAAYPGILLFLDIANNEEIQEHLLANKLDIALVEGFVTHPDLVKQVWRQDELVLVAPANYQVKQVSIKQIIEGQLPLILREKGSGTRAVLEEALAERGLAPLNVAMDLGSSEAIKQAVRAGLGISFISEHTIQLELNAGLLKRVPIADFTLIRPLYLVFTRAKRLSKAVQAFLDLIK